MKIFVVFLATFFAQNTFAQAPKWDLQPSICVVQNIGDVCEMLIKIDAHHLPQETFCLFLEDALIRCSKRAYFPQEIALTIKQNATLELKDAAHKTVLSKQLKIKYLESTHLRRRVRAPWSLF
ncbi:DUF3019 domain-containing protein [Paraglaciecola aestuariivivens]